METSMRTGRILLATLILAATVGAVTAAPAAAVQPPFTEPDEWADICTVKRPRGTALVRGTNCRWLRLDGVWRRYLVYIPRTFPLDRRWPLVFMFHGTGGDGEKFHNISGWKELADQQGFIVVFGTAWRYDIIVGGNKTKWHYFELDEQIHMDVRLDGYPEDSPYPARDVRFVDLMLADVDAQVRLAPRKLYVAGFSNGAQFSARLAVQRSEVFAAAAWNAGSLDVIRDPTRNMSVLFGIGTKDDRLIEAYNASHDPDITEVPLEWDEALAVMPEYVGNPVSTFGMRPLVVDVSEAATHTRAVWDVPRAGEDDGQVVRFILMDEVIHQYPRPGNNEHDFFFAAMSWAFFEQHPMP
jgi:polyhydroxybutyrate depolymerase